MSIFGNFFGDKTLDNIEQNLNNLFTNIQSMNSAPNKKDITKSMEQTMMNMLTQNDDINKILESVTIPPDRTMRYHVYEEIVRTAPFMKRVLRVYQPYILQKNPTTGKFYIIRKVSDSDNTAIENKEKSDEATKKLETFIKQYNFMDLLKKRINPNTILFGDCFVEIVDKKDEDRKVDLNKLITINEANIERLNNELLMPKKNDYDKFFDLLAESLVITEPVSNKPEKPEDTSPRTMEDLMLRVHRPHEIMILETKYGTRLGYLEITKDDMTKTHNIAQSLSTLVGRLTQNSALNSTMKPDDIVNKLVLAIIKKIMSTTDKKDAEKALHKLSPEVHKFIRNIVIEQNLQSKVEKVNTVRVRFIRSDRMQQFTLPLTTEYLPYGTSLLDPIVLPCKLYILSQLGNIITKLSRAPAIRKWTIEQGTSQMSGQLIQKLKRELNNSRITVEDLGSWKSIPKILSDYKDLYLLSRQGNKSLDVEITSLGDPSVKIQDLQDARSEIIALSGIPAPYLGYNEVIELREQLVH